MNRVPSPPKVDQYSHLQARLGQDGRLAVTLTLDHLQKKIVDFKWSNCFKFHENDSKFFSTFKTLHLFA